MTKPGGEGSSFKIADAYVLIGGKLDDKSVQQTVGEAQKSADRTPLNLKVGLDKRSLNTAVTEIRTSVRDLSKDLSVKISVTLNQKSLADLALAVLAAADEMSRQGNISLKVGINGASVAKASTDLGVATRSMGAVNGINLKVNSDELKDGDNTVKTFSNHWTRLATLVTGGIALGAGPVELGALGAVAAVFAGIGVAAEKSDKLVASSFSDMSNAAKQTMQQGFGDIAPVLEHLADDGKAAVTSLKTEFALAGQQIAPMLDQIGGDLINSVRNGVDDTVPLLSKLSPLATSIGNSFGTLEKGVAGFVNNIDVGGAAAGWDSLSGAVSKVLSPLSLVLNAVAPLSTALISTLGSALSVAEREFANVKPVASALGAVLGLLSPVISFLGPPMLLVAGASKLLGGSWFDLSAAGTKISAFFKELPAGVQSLGQKLGYTTQATLDASKAAAQLARDDALLAKDVDTLALSEAEAKAATSGSAEDALATSVARRQLRTSTEAAKDAELEFSKVSAATSFSMGPLVGILATVGLAVGLFATQTSDAGNATQDLSQQIIQMGNATSGSVGDIISGSDDLKRYADAFKDIGTNAQQFARAYSGSAAQAQSYTDNLTASQEKLGSTMVGIREGDSNIFYESSLGTSQISKSIKQLTEDINSGKSPRDLYTKQLLDQVDEYNAYNEVVPQSKKALDDFKASQDSARQALAAQGLALSSTQTAWDSLGGKITSSVSNFNSATAGIKQLTDNTLSAKEAFFSAQQNFVQLGQAVTSAQQGLEQAGEGVASAQHGVGAAAQSAAAALRSEQSAALAVTNSQFSYKQSLQASANAQIAYNSSLVSETSSEKAVTQARKDALQSLKDLQRQVIDGTDTQAEAELRLHDAQQAVNAAGLQHSTLSLADLANQSNITAQNEQKYQLLLALSEAQHNLNDVTAAGQQTIEQNTLAQQLGVEGSSGVVSAQQALVQSQQQVVQASQSMQSALNSITSASQSVKDAQYAQGQAHQASANAVYEEGQASLALKQAIQNQTNAAKALTTAKTNDTNTTDLSTQQGVQNYLMLENLFEKNYQATGSIQSATAATEDEGKKMGFTAGQVDAVANSVTGLNGKTAVFGVVGQPSVDISQIVAAAVQQGINPEGLGFTPAQVQTALGAPIAPTGAHRAAAGGGLLSGAGTTTSDSILGMTETGPVALSDQEFVVNAKDTKRTLPVLEHINSGGSVPGFAAGGQLGKALMSANLRLAAWDAGVGALANTYTMLGYKGIPFLPKPPPLPIASGGGGGSTATAKSGNAAQAQQYAQSIMGSYGWGPEQWIPWLKLGNEESGWNAYAVNASSGAYGIGQSLGHGHPYELGDYAAQVVWMANYIKGRYKTPAAAWAFETSHVPNWYDQGGLLPQGLSMAVNNTGAGEHKGVFTNQQWSDLHAIANSKSSGEVHYHSHTTVLAQGNDDAHSIATMASADAQWKIITMVNR